MPQKVIRFSGINRKVSEFQGSGTCEELINIRPTASGLEVVRPKLTKFSGVNYDIYNHSFGDKSLLIGLLRDDLYQVLLIDEQGETTEIDTLDDRYSDYDIAFVGNQMILSSDTETRVYAYRNDTYERVYANVPDLDIEYTITDGKSYLSDITQSYDTSSVEFKDAIMKQWSAALGNNPLTNEIFGPIMLAFNYTLSDGTEFWTNKWIHINPFRHNDDDGRMLIYYHVSDTSGINRFFFPSYALNFTIGQIQPVEDTSMIESVNVYASRPIFPYNLDGLSTESGAYPVMVYAPSLSMEDSGIDKQLLYFQKSIKIDDLERGDVSVVLDFGNTQTGERVLEVDNGPVTRAGKVLSYNNRVHFYDSYSTIHPQSLVCRSEAESLVERTAYIALECNGDAVRIQTTAMVPESTGQKISCCYPDARAKKALIENPDGTYTSVILKPSSRYNYAYGEEVYGGDMMSAMSTTSNVVREANAVNVSAQYNPFVFQVENSYNFGGRVLDMVTAYLPISSTQIGQYPLTVFTSSGIYAMEQGSGAVLYGNIIPLQPMVITGKAVATPYGTFFVSSKTLYLLSGRDVTNMSYVMSGELELTLRENDAYKSLCCKEDDIFYDFSGLLSSRDFEEYISDAVLTYDQLRNELHISDDWSAIHYSYVLNLDTKSYHKLSRKHIAYQRGSRYAICVSGQTRNVVDLQEESKDSQPILLQSRPMPLDVFYSHIHRLVFFTDAELIKDQHLCLSVFAGDNLHDWRCIISSQKHDTILRQIRTNRAAKSYKDYIILISGMVGTETDLYDLIADYTVVNRRLG